MCTKPNRCRRTRRYAILTSRTDAGCIRTSPVRRASRGFLVDPSLGMAGRCVQGLIDMLEQNYGGDVTKMPYVVNKEAFGRAAISN